MSCGLPIKPVDKPLYGLGSTTVPSVRAVGMTQASVAVDDLCPDLVTLLVVSDMVQVPDVIIGRAWLDLPEFVYHKSGGRLYIYKAEPYDGGTEVAVDALGNEADYLQAVEVDVLLVKKPLLKTEFGYVNSELSVDDEAALLGLVNEYRDCFATSLYELGCTPLMTVGIHEVPNSRPVVCRPYKTTRTDREEISKIVQEWKSSGVVVDTVSPYASPVLLVKQDGINRLCVDYRRLNKQTIRQHYPLPDMSEQLEALAAGKMFIQLDSASGYLQIPLTPEAAEKTAFITADTTDQFTRMPFGLSSAVAEFTRLMQYVLGPLQGKTVHNYLDDMVIDGSDWPDLLTKLRTVLERLKSAALTLKPSKYLFGTKSIEFLGLVVGGGEIRPRLKKTRAINEYPVSEDAHSLRRFLGLASFFRRFIPNFALIAAPLNKLTRKGERFCWREEHEVAFRELQTALVSDTVLTLFRPDAATTELHTDTSTIGLGAMLLQSVKLDHLLRVVYYTSRKTSNAETRYHSSKLELLCLVWSMNKVRPLYSSLYNHLEQVLSPSRRRRLIHRLSMRATTFTFASNLEH